MNKKKPPIVLIFYKRKKCIAKSIQSILLTCPSKIYLISDGGKNKNEEKVIKNLRIFVENKIKKKNCKFIKVYSLKNLGLKKNIINGLNYVFSKEKSAIIIEEDCIVDISFFNFCFIILNRFKNNNKVWGVTAQTFLKNEKDNYYFSKYAHCWGWATWADRWKKFNFDRSKWIKWSKSNFWKKSNTNYIDDLEILYWKKIYTDVFDSKINSWNYIWQSFIWKKKGLFIHPPKNLVENIGFNKGYTNTSLLSKSFLYLKKNKLSKIKFHPKVKHNYLGDKIIFDKVYFSHKFFLKNFFFKVLKLNLINKEIFKRFVLKNFKKNTY
jgi:hypothetical protein